MTEESTDWLRDAATGTATPEDTTPPPRPPGKIPAGVRTHEMPVEDWLRHVLRKDDLWL